MREVPVFDPTQAFGGSDNDPSPSSQAYRDRVAGVFKRSPGAWIDGRALGRIGGEYAWRTRVSECRTQLGMNIKNRQRRENKRTVSEYCYIPKEAMFRLEAPPDDERGSKGRP